MSNEIYKQTKIDPSASFIVTADHITRYTLKGVFLWSKAFVFSVYFHLNIFYDD